MTPSSRTLRTDLLMLAAAAIWGSTFVAQRLGMDTIGPFLYTGARFLLGAAMVAPLWWWRPGPLATHPVHESRGIVPAGLVLGLVLFAAVNLQQVGLLGTSVSNAGFITGLYVVIVPVLMLAFGERAPGSTWAAVGLAAGGLYLLSVQPDAGIAAGDWLQLGGAGLWAVHMMLVGVYARRHDTLRLAVLQYTIAGLLSLAVALWREPLSAAALSQAAGAIAYGGVLSVGLAYTLQVVAQRTAQASHAAIIYSSEGVFSALAGWAFMGDQLGLRGWGGAALMVVAMLLAQWRRDHEPEVH
ncbi:drug/metabolite transporter (DMT)-like permease [Sphaerotilus hippei]|uniref:Drug/metabolite transporter (DMT)-like permease n=1 Tax=Sphaerotilus hippei TaxID=744406 RepID=A0A318GYF4_9BURK|nr:DMT family transporter [Sphaerotilus hippei]PXW94994.1 drug/metabolite transporter (DMT)-like permease [Sphaerotilus hippei]